MTEKTDAEFAAEFSEKLLDSTLENAASQITWQPLELEDGQKLTPNEAKERFKQSLRKTLEDTKEENRIQHGSDVIRMHLGEYPSDRLCLKELDRAANNITTSLESIFGPKLNNARKVLSELNLEKLNVNHNKEIENPLEKKATPSLATQLIISPETLAVFYQIGVKLYEAGEMEDAISVFTYLSVLDSYNPSVWFTRGMCHQRLQEWIEAIQAYASAGKMNPENPMSYFYSIDCLLALNEKALAEVSFQQAEKAMDNKNFDQFASLVDHYQKLIAQHP